MSKGWAEESEVMFPFVYEGPHHVLVCVNLCVFSLVLANVSRYHLKPIEPMYIRTTKAQKGRRPHQNGK